MKDTTKSTATDQAARPGAAAHVDTNPPAPDASACSSSLRATEAEQPNIEFDQIQGNCFGGFLKDQQVNILFSIVDPDAARAKVTLGPVEDQSETTNEIDTDFENGIFSHVKHSSSEAVIRFNDKFRALRQAGMDEGTIKATWTNLVFTSKGLTKVKLGRKPLSEAFEQGMIARATDIGDIDLPGKDSIPAVTNAPGHWNEDMDVAVVWEQVDGMLILASDDPDEMDRMIQDSRLARTLAKLQAANSGITVLGIIRGQTRVDNVGHEHFGFKDGVSQPGIRGVDSSDDALHNPDQGNPGQDLLHPGEFVIGYPTQIAAEGFDDDKKLIGGPNPHPGETVSFPDVDYAKNGSFLVFRRLAQDVKAFSGGRRIESCSVGDHHRPHGGQARWALPQRRASGGSRLPVGHGELRGANDRSRHRASGPRQQQRAQ